MNDTLRAFSHASADYASIEIGYEPGGTTAGRLQFGASAEVLISSEFGGPLAAKVSFAAIGSHAPEIGRQRARVYMAAIEIADQANNLFRLLGPDAANDAVAVVSRLVAYNAGIKWTANGLDIF